MIVISGALVLVALVLLIIGVVGPDLAFVYASIAVSLVSLVFLVVGILQRRGEPVAAAEGADAPQPVTVEDPAEGVTIRPSSLRRAPAPALEDDADVPAPVADTADEEPVADTADEGPVADTADEGPVAGGDVLVVEGRPRYHVVGCRYLSGKTPEAVDVVQARAEGFTPCGVCRPDVALAALAEEEAALEPETDALPLDVPEDAQVEVEEAGPAPVVEEDVPGVEVAPAARRTATRTAARKSPAGSSVPATDSAPAKAPRKAAATRAAAPVAAAPARAPRGGTVVVIPDRGRYHREACRYVRDVEGAEVLSKSAATRQGYAPCGVCKP